LLLYTNLYTNLSNVSQHYTFSNDVYKANIRISRNIGTYKKLNCIIASEKRVHLFSYPEEIDRDDLIVTIS